MHGAEHWNERYAGGATPWDTGVPDPHLADVIAAFGLTPGRVLELGCGTGTNAIWLAQQGYTVVGVDLAPLAIERARAADPGGTVEFRVADVLVGTLPGGPFDLVYDRGCFHVFDLAADRARFAEVVAAHLSAAGRWLSIIGSTEGPARETGPPRRSVRDLAEAIEPRLEFVELRAIQFSDQGEGRAAAWRCLTQRRATPAQPSTRR